MSGLSGEEVSSVEGVSPRVEVAFLVEVLLVAFTYRHAEIVAGAVPE
jgi:hypothetical protein